MNYFTFPIILFFVFISKAFGQWIIQNSNLSESRGISYISAVDKDVVWATAYDGANPEASCNEFTRTVDGGNIWIPGIINTIQGTKGLKPSMIFALDDHNAWVPMHKINGNNPQGIYASNDGGYTWFHQPTALFSDSSSFPDCIHFWDENSGWCLGDPVDGEFEMYTTTNGGNQWIAVPGVNIPDPVKGETGVIGYYSVFGNMVWFGTNKGRVFKSNNRGLSWTAAVCSPFSGMYIRPYFIDENLGLVMDLDATSGNPGRLAISTDGGNTFDPIISTSKVFWYGLAYIPGSGSTWVSTGANTKSTGMTYSFDNGKTWSEMTTIQGVQFLISGWIDDSTGWVGGFVNSGAGGIYKFNGHLTPPLPGFDVSDTIVESGGNITFTDRSTGNPIKYFWTFEGGSPKTSTLKSPVKVRYNKPGIYDVILETTNEWERRTIVKKGLIRVGSAGNISR